MRFVTHDYFTVMGMTVRGGRDFSASDRAGSERVTIVNEALAARFFPNEDPIGQVLQTLDEKGERIIGVVSDAAEASLVEGPVPARYVLYPQMPFVHTSVAIVMRTADRSNLAPLVQAARQTIERESPQLAVQQTTTLRNIFDLAVGPLGQLVTLVGILTGLALVLGAVGVYGVISHFVQRRSREYGIRIALGPSPAQVVGQVLRRGVALVALGSAIGSGGRPHFGAAAGVDALWCRRERSAVDGWRGERSARGWRAGSVRAGTSRQLDRPGRRAAARLIATGAT